MTPISQTTMLLHDRFKEILHLIPTSKMSSLQSFLVSSNLIDLLYTQKHTLLYTQKSNIRNSQLRTALQLE